MYLGVLIDIFTLKYLKNGNESMEYCLNQAEYEL